MGTSCRGSEGQMFFHMFLDTEPWSFDTPLQIAAVLSASTVMQKVSLLFSGFSRPRARNSSLLIPSLP